MFTRFVYSDGIHGGYVFSYHLQRFHAQFLLMRLRHSTQAQDDASEALAASFIRQEPSSSSGAGTPGGRDVELFVQEFRELRKTYHKRVIWGDKWSNGQVEWRDD